MSTYGVGLDWKTGDYYVVVNSQRTRSFASCAAALGFIDSLREWESAEAARERALESELARARDREAAE